MHDDRKRIHRIAGDQDVELHHRRLPRARPGGSRAKRSRARPTSACRRSRARSRSAAAHRSASRACELTYSNSFCLPRFSSTSFRMPPTYSSLVRMVARITGSSIFSISLGSGQREGLSTSIDRAVGQRDAVAHAGRGGDQVEVVLALQPLLDDLHVQQAEEAAAEAEAQRHRTFRLEEERRIVEPQLFQRLAQQRCARARPRCRARRRPSASALRSRAAARSPDAASSVMVSPILVSATFLMLAIRKPTSPAVKLVHLDRLGRQHAQGLHVEGAGHSTSGGCCCPCAACP